MIGRIIHIFGEPWTWKSHLGVSVVEHVEGDLEIFDFDNNLQAVLPKFSKHEKRIKVHNCPIPAVMGTDQFVPDPAKYQADQVWRRVATIYKKACDSPTTGSILLDTDTVFYQIARENRMLQVIAEGKEAGKNRTTLSTFEYGPINIWMKQVLDYAKTKGKTLILLSHARRVYGPDDEPTEDWESDGWGKTRAAADIDLQTLRPNSNSDVLLLCHKSTFHPKLPRVGLPCSWETVETLCQGKLPKKESK